jgi:hypothetical protein
MICRSNPTLEELQNSDEYEQIAILEHTEVKEFVMEQLSGDSRRIRGFMVYQLVMILAGLLFATRPIVLAIHGDFHPLYWLIGAVVFSFTLLIFIHELLHLFAFKLTGAPHVKIGGYIRQFIFYAEADQHVLNRKQFIFVALTPLIAVKIITLAGIFFTFHHPAFYFWMFIMSVHSLFCAGDIGMIAFFDRFPDSEIFTFDMRATGQSYFYKKNDNGETFEK